ncbi:MAG TPA: TerC family protein [Polyangiaceae bacterium LLY-WYZ-15_(1-7)]|nr:hypothetical protein [Myxococcales bacterium]MAT25425.1 hypothetical protein [Sandaracinus sp.]HJL00179.1 TerC family protein [Polyangiaceae bacterium LLY-WYZ-15_(1-7)]HJL13704.1 TerC family protein [Polyangiaceae bacterium LLY-WYZ-15_(1-7)]HJL33326.1 TerC family protein [Polyangiaceae bacterium LLY-WYZ-15_(1-7)]
MFDAFATADGWVALLTLTALETILGIDNVVFIAILTAKLPKDQQKTAYRLGLLGAMLSRIALLFAISWVMGLTEPLFGLFGKEITGRSLILLGGGLFLMYKAATEIYEKVEGPAEEEEVARRAKGLWSAIFQITLLDIVFSLDSVITAVGVVDDISVMVVAVMVSIGIMLAFAKPIGDFVNNHPSMKILALSFLLLIGLLLVAEGFGEHLDKRYIYFAMGFGLSIELLNMRFRKKNPEAEL